jgi:hypothetical protein
VTEEDLEVEIEEAAEVEAVEEVSAAVVVEAEV